MKYIFDTKLLNLLKLQDCEKYSISYIHNCIINQLSDEIVLNKKHKLNNNLIYIMKNKFPKNSELSYDFLIKNPGYWYNQYNDGFSKSALKEITMSFININIQQKYFDKGIVVNNIQI